MKSSAERRKIEATPEYRAPALEKGLDILELLSRQGDGLPQAQIADSLNRSVSEIFRMLEVLVKRGYIEKQESGDAYRLTSRLFELAHRHPPIQRLLDAALPEMRTLAEDIDQSCHLAIRFRFSVLVVAHVESPAAMGYAVRLGSRHDLLKTGSGRVLLAFQPEDVLERWLHAARAREIPQEKLAALPKKLSTIRRRGYEKSPSGLIRGVTDLSAPIRDQAGKAVAALTVPFLIPLDGSHSSEEALRALRETAARISQITGGVSE